MKNSENVGPFPCLVNNPGGMIVFYLQAQLVLQYTYNCLLIMMFTMVRPESRFPANEMFREKMRENVKIFLFAKFFSAKILSSYLDMF